MYAWSDGSGYGTYCMNSDANEGTITDQDSGDMYYAVQMTSSDYTCANDLDCEIWSLSTGQNLDFCCGAVNTTNTETEMIGQINYCVSKN
mmetsp:Transcript_13554/g.13289  ORF Transcript_13554/g.13289 Transcript_13554/m.13289 type:complete len:90 (+) Transcript_13554:313-582(+)